MTPEWATVAVVAGVSLLSFAVNWGTFGRAIKDHDKRIDKIEEDTSTDSKLQWAHINATETSLANVKGQLGLNGRN